MNTLNSNLKSKHILLAGMLSLGAMTVFAVPSLSGEITASYSVSEQSQTVKGVVVTKVPENRLLEPMLLSKELQME